MPSKHVYLLGLVLSLILIVGVASSQFGMMAGQPHLNVYIGGSNTTNITLMNTGSMPISFNVILPVFPNLKNESVPNVTMSVTSGTIPPHQNMKIYITASLPKNGVKANDTWEGVIQFVQVANTTNPGGAVVASGLAKILTVTAIPAPFSFPWDSVIGVIVLVAIVGTITKLYLTKGRRKASARKSAKRSMDATTSTAGNKRLSSKGRRAKPRKNPVNRKKSGKKQGRKVSR